MTGGDLEAHQRALCAAVGAGGMVAGLGGERPVVSVIRAALEAALAHWDDLGLDAATSGYQAEGSDQYGEAERQAHAEILPLINEIYDRSRDVLHARLDADDHRRVLSEGALARIAAGDAGVETDMDVGCSRGQETIMLQVLAVQHIADQDDMWRQRLQVTDGATRMVAYAYSHHHDALADSLHAVITVTEWTWLLDATEAGRGGGYLVLTAIVPPDVGDPFQPDGPLREGGTPYVGAGNAALAPVGPHRVDGTDASDAGVQPVAPRVCDGRDCASVEAGRTGTHLCKSPGAGCIMRRIQLPDHAAVWNDNRWTRDRMVGRAQPKEKRMARYCWCISNVFGVRGGGNRAMLPPCVVTHIRAEDPNPIGVPYTDDRTDGDPEGSIVLDRGADLSDLLD